MHPASPAKQTWLTTLGWAAYLACSWTWCIGMFLPVLLVRDFGIWGFVVFAVPNVVGAAAMGWVLTGPGAAELIVQRHGDACRAFSWITAAFQLFFLMWAGTSLFRPVPNGSQSGVWLALAFFALLCVAIAAIDPAGVFQKNGFGLKRPLVRTIAPLMLWLGSMAIAIAMALRGDLSWPSSSTDAPAGLLALAPVCIFGFVLCPYLDLTFLHARCHAIGRAGAAAFTLGFGVLFLCMILFTLGYAHQFLGGSRLAIRSGTVTAFLLITHMFVQLFYTIMLHLLHALRGRPQRGGPPIRWRSLVRILIPALVFTAAVLLVTMLPEQWRFYRGLSLGEITYRLFMSFYGLVFPAYVWLCMIPVRGERGTQPPSRRKLTVLAIAVALASPCFWMGFIERQTWWLGPGLGIVLLTRLFIPRPSTSGDRSVPSNA